MVPLYGPRCFNLFMEDEEIVPIYGTKRGKDTEFLDPNMPFNQDIKRVRCDSREIDYNDRKNYVSITVGETPIIVHHYHYTLR